MWGNPVEHLFDLVLNGKSSAGGSFTLSWKRMHPSDALNQMASCVIPCIGRDAGLWHETMDDPVTLTDRERWLAAAWCGLEPWLEAGVVVKSSGQVTAG